MSERNKQQLQKKINFKRQLDIFNPTAFNSSVTIAGTGNIGSQAAIALARLGIKEMILYDHDKVEEHNLASQAFNIDDIGGLKAHKLRRHIMKINKDIKSGSLSEKYLGHSSLSDILIIAVDSMEERKKICNNLKQADTKPDKIIDGRAGGPQLEIYTCNDCSEWEETFVDDVEREPCTERYISYASMIIGALIANQVKRVLKSEPYKKSILFHVDSLQLI